MKESDFIVKKAKALGACSLLKRSASAIDLESLMWTPQGKEFIAKRAFPKLDSLERAAKEGKIGILVNEGDVQSYSYKTAAAGNTFVTLVADNVREKYDVILFHGASVIIEASNYAVVQVTRVGECHVMFLNIDGTARLLE